MPEKKSKKTKELQGNLKNRMHEETSLVYIEPQKPVNLNEDALEVWERIAPIGIKTKMLNIGTADLWVEYCELVAEVRKLKRMVEEECPDRVTVNYYVDPTGTERTKTKTHPLVEQLRRARGQLKDFAKELKLRPADMVGLYNLDAEKTDEFDL